MRRLIIAFVLVLAFASVGSAQVSFVPSADLGFMTYKFMDDGVEVTRTNYTQIALGVTANYQNGFLLSGTYAFGSGGDITSGGSTITPESNRSTKLRIDARYALYETGAFSVGPIVDYYQSTISMKDSAVEPTYKEKMNGFGVGAFVSAQVDPVDLSLVWIHRPSAKISAHIDGIKIDEADGTGNYVAVNATMPLSGPWSLTASYESDNPIKFEAGGVDYGTDFSGFKIGARYAF